MNLDLPNPGVTEATPAKLQANAFLLWVFGLMNFRCLMMFFFFGFVDEFVVWWCFFFSRLFDDVFSLGFLFEICFRGLISNIEIDSPKLDLPSAFFFVVLLGSSSMESFLLRAWVLHRVLPWVPFFITIFLQFLQNLKSSSCYSDSSSSSMKLDSLRLEFHVAKISPCQQSISRV